jgi:ABC-type glutathione transport system ATPase component
MTPPLLEVDAVTVRHRARSAPTVTGVSLSIEAGKTLGIVGESGCGKSTLARALLGLLPIQAGTLRWQGRDITRLRPRQRLQGGIGMQIVFQDPNGSLDPRPSAHDLIVEPLVVAGWRWRSPSASACRPTRCPGAPTSSPAANGSASPSREPWRARRSC